MSVNIVVQSGVVKSPALRYDAQGRPECRFTLQQVENGFTLYLPCCALGAAAERVAEQISDGDHIVITSGRLTYRKRNTKLGEQSRLEILCWSVERLTESPQVERSDDDATPAVRGKLLPWLLSPPRRLRSSTGRQRSANRAIRGSRRY